MSGAVRWEMSCSRLKVWKGLRRRQNYPLLFPTTFLHGCSGECKKASDDLDVGATGCENPWPTKKHLANICERIQRRIHMQVECRGMISTIQQPKDSPTYV